MTTVKAHHIWQLPGQTEWVEETMATVWPDDKNQARLKQSFLGLIIMKAQSCMTKVILKTNKQTKKTPPSWQNILPLT